MPHSVLCPHWILTIITWVSFDTHFFLEERAIVHDLESDRDRTLLVDFLFWEEFYYYGLNVRMVGLPLTPFQLMWWLCLPNAARVFLIRIRTILWCPFLHLPSRKILPRWLHFLQSLIIRFCLCVVLFRFGWVLSVLLRDV